MLTAYPRRRRAPSFVRALTPLGWLYLAFAASGLVVVVTAFSR